MADTEKPSKENDLQKVKSNQQALKSQIKQLEDGLSAPKVYSFQTEEIREMTQTLLTQNKRLAEKVDYLLSILVEASQDMSDDVFDKTLAAMGQAQVDMIDQLTKIREKSEEGEAKTEELEKLYKITEEKLTSISDTLSQLSFAKQLEDLKSNVTTLSSDVQKLEGAITTATPALKENINNLRLELTEMKQQVTDMGLFGSEIKEIETELSDIEKMLTKKEAGSVAELSQLDKEALQDLSKKMYALETEVKKMEKAIESYPSSEAQDITSIKQKLEEIDIIVNASGGPQQGVSKELEGLRAKISQMENLFEQKELDMENRREAEMKLITELLQKIETDLEKTSGQQATQLSQVLSELNDKTKELAENVTQMSSQNALPRYMEDFKSEVTGMTSRLDRIEGYVKTEKVADYSHIADVQTEIRAIRKELESMRGMKINQQVISQVREDLRGVAIPRTKVISPEEKQKIFSIRSNIDKTSRAIPSSKENIEIKTDLNTAKVKVDRILGAIDKTEQGIIEQREAVKKLRGDVIGAPLRKEDLVANYIMKLSLGAEVKVKDVAIILNMDSNELIRILLAMQKESPDTIEVKNTKYVSKLIGKEPVLVRSG